MSASCAPLPEVSLESAPRGLSLRRNFSWTLLGNVVYMGSQWGMLVILAKLGSPRVVGEFALGLAIAGPVLMFCNLALRSLLASDLHSRSQFGTYLSLRLTTAAIAFITVTFLGLGAKHRGEALWVILGVGLAKAFESVSDIMYGLLQQHERMDWIAKSMMIKGPLSLAGFGVAMLLTHSVVWAVSALAVAWALLLISYDVRNAARVLRYERNSSSFNVLQARSAFPEVRRLALTALPLAFVVTLISLTGNLPRYFVERYCGASQLGIFAAMAYLPVAATTLVSALAESAFPKLAKYYAQENMAAFRALTLKLVGVGASLGIAGILVVGIFGREILTILYRPEYAEHADVFLWLMLAAGIGYVGTFLGTMLTSTRAFKSFVFPYIIFTIISAASCWLLIPQFGIKGAAWGMGVTALASVTVPLVIFFGSVKRQTA